MRWQPFLESLRGFIPKFWIVFYRLSLAGQASKITATISNHSDAIKLRGVVVEQFLPERERPIFDDLL